MVVHPASKRTENPKTSNLVNVYSQDFKESPKFQPNTKFDICYINLDREKDRKEHIERILKRANCSFTRFEAVDGNKLYNKEKTIRDYTSPLGLDEYADLIKPEDYEQDCMPMIGCKLSHYLYLRKIEKSGTTKNILILEDDIDFEYNFISLIENAMKDLPSEWDMMLTTFWYNVHEQNEEKEESKVVRAAYFFECLGYIVNGAKAAKKIADLIQQKCAPNATVDLFLAQEAIDKRLDLFAMKTPVAVQRRDLFQTTISTSDQIPQKKVKDSILNYID